MPLDEIIEAQARWARLQWAGHNSKRAPSLEENLIQPLYALARKEFESGSGGELGKVGKPGKMTSLRSSSALGYNVFGPWNGLDLTPVSVALESPIGSRDVHFEHKFRHGLSSQPPNIDVVFDLKSSSPLALECKFTEPYGSKASHPSLDAKYFAGGRKRWVEVGLPKCQAVAEEIGVSITYCRLAAGQLLKHFLGLANTTKQMPRLRYVWFDSRCSEAAEHRAEIQRFEEAVDREIDFRAITYQDVAHSLRRYLEPVPGYHAYLESRYFGA